MDHPVFQNRLRLAIWWLTWSLMTLGQLFLYNYAYKNFLKFIIPDIIISFTAYAGISLVIWYPFKYFNSKSLKIQVLVSNIIVMGAVSLTLWILLSKYMMIFLISEPSSLSNYWEATLPYRLGTGALIYILVILTYYLIMSLSDLAKKKAREAMLESVIKETELKMLRSQINPHFLFNTLNSINALTVTDPAKARAMIVKLSDFMRYSVSRKDEQPVTLQSELDNMRLYLEIEKVRFGARLKYEEYIDEKCLNTRIPVLLLQPLYENAVKYGIHESTGVVTLITKIACRNKYVEITISNNFETDNARTKGTGTGLANVSKRLELCYADKASVKTEIRGNIFTVALLLPLESKT